ncbi:isochorismatase family cysteine hydrolase [Allonocardiopsis opalescens]|uniref:Nicotinamidase-related amidase n=1 Tax=Allonocardiopsis opalescens TaxID=1144618 RepID=A0A2T0PVE4_9ACTN|nr:isochorismatase family cysteine hydrolase [Allonocardiopsis opalescens]PRX95477.1 nicotinamidase-related amidase [Allonocardiopsis opalescens]
MADAGGTESGIVPKLHDWRIDAEEYARHEARRGRRYAYEDLDPARTALVVVDMVAFFVAGDAYCRGIVPNVDRLARTLRSAGGTVVWVLPEADAVPSDWAVGFFGPRVAAAYARSGGSGTPSARLWPGLRPEAGDLWADKSASSAFFPGRSPVPELLRERGVDTVLITGTVTGVCCESSARDASTLGYRVIVVADATAGGADRLHNASLRTVYRSFGDVRPTDEVLRLIAAGA